MIESVKKVAVIGSGVSGIVAAFLLGKSKQVVLYEKASRLGGHTHTVVIDDGKDQGLAIDTGFIVLNDKNYPLFHQFLNELSVPVRYSDMSFGFSCSATGLEWSSKKFSSLFAVKRNMLDPRYIYFLISVMAFFKLAKKSLRVDSRGSMTLRAWCAQHHIPSRVIHDFIIPFAGAIWSSSDADVLEFPASSMFEFFENHGMLSYADQPRWQTVVGGSHAYLKAFEKVFSGTVRLNQGVVNVSRGNQAVEITDSTGTKERFDAVVFACHADQVLPLLQDPSAQEVTLLAPWKYQANRTVLHTDSRLLPKREAARASWNYLRYGKDDGTLPVSITYDMNRLQGLTTKERYLVTLNPRIEITQERIIKDMVYHHPIYSREAVETQNSLSLLQGQARSYFCGSYFGSGFHEDAVKSAWSLFREIA